MKSQLLSVEHQARKVSALGWVAVEWVARNGMTEVVEVDPDLVAPARTGMGFDERMWSEALQHAEIGNAGLTPLRIDSDAARAALAQRVIDCALVLYHHAMDKGQVGLLDLPGLELLIQKAMGPGIAREDNHAAGASVEAVDDE